MTEAMSLSPADADRVDAALLRYRDDVVAGMRAALDRPDAAHVRLMRYHLGWEDANGATIAPSGGKMLRPALCLLCCEAVGGERRRAMWGAVALELVHNFTLIHDDIEDGSDTRHGRATLWRIAGVPQAINAGDGMFVLAQRTLLRMTEDGVPAERVLEAARVLNEACVALCEGQYADIGFETRDRVTQREYEAMIAGKTAALLGASGAIGAIAGGADAATTAAIAKCGRMLGLAFQIQDDVLGIWGEEAVTGKPVADDIRSRKKSFPVVWAFDQLEGAAAARLSQIYAAEGMGAADVDEVLRLLDDAGARERAVSDATGYAEQAVGLLAGLELDAERQRDLEALAAFFVHRSA
jgi:geranylgeranyl diphosphate synthase type I